MYQNNRKKIPKECFLFIKLILNKTWSHIKILKFKGVYYI